MPWMRGCSTPSSQSRSDERFFRDGTSENANDRRSIVSTDDLVMHKVGKLELSGPRRLAGCRGHTGIDHDRNISAALARGDPPAASAAMRGSDCATAARRQGREGVGWRGHASRLPGRGVLRLRRSCSLVRNHPATSSALLGLQPRALSVPLSTPNSPAPVPALPSPSLSHIISRSSRSFPSYHLRFFSAPPRPPFPSFPAMDCRTAFVAATSLGRVGGRGRAGGRLGDARGGRRPTTVMVPARRCRMAAVQQVDHDGLEAALKSDSTTPLLVDFYAPW